MAHSGEGWEGYDILKEGRRETFVPPGHPPGLAQVDFGEVISVIGGVPEDPRVLHGCFAFGRAFIRPTRRSPRGVSRRPCQCVRLLRRRAAVDPLRQHHAGGGADPRRLEQVGSAPHRHRAQRASPMWPSPRTLTAVNAGIICAILHDAVAQAKLPRASYTDRTPAMWHRIPP